MVNYLGPFRNITSIRCAAGACWAMEPYDDVNGGQAQQRVCGSPPYTVEAHPNDVGQVDWYGTATRDADGSLIVLSWNGPRWRYFGAENYSYRIYDYFGLYAQTPGADCVGAAVHRDGNGDLWLRAICSASTTMVVDGSTVAATEWTLWERKPNGNTSRTDYYDAVTNPDGWRQVAQHTEQGLPERYGWYWNASGTEAQTLFSNSATNDISPEAVGAGTPGTARTGTHSRFKLAVSGAGPSFVSATWQEITTDENSLQWQQSRTQTWSQSTNTDGDGRTIDVRDEDISWTAGYTGRHVVAVDYQGDTEVLAWVEGGGVISAQRTIHTEYWRSVRPTYETETSTGWFEGEGTVLNLVVSGNTYLLHEDPANGNQAGRSVTVQETGVLDNDDVAVTGSVPAFYHNDRAVRTPGVGLVHCPINYMDLRTGWVVQTEAYYVEEIEAFSVNSSDIELYSGSWRTLPSSATVNRTITDGWHTQDDSTTLKRTESFAASTMSDRIGLPSGRITGAPVSDYNDVWPGNCGLEALGGNYYKSGAGSTSDSFSFFSQGKSGAKCYSMHVWHGQFDPPVYQETNRNVITGGDLEALLGLNTSGTYHEADFICLIG